MSLAALILAIGALWLLAVLGLGVMALRKQNLGRLRLRDRGE